MQSYLQSYWVPAIGWFAHADDHDLDDDDYDDDKDNVLTTDSCCKG